MNLDGLHLRAISESEYARFFERSHREYAEEIARNARVSMEQALDKSTNDFAKLLPDGRATVDQHIFVIVDDADEVIGELWLGLSEKIDGREAFGFDFWVEPTLRDQGIGRRAMELAAAQARQLGANRLALSVFGGNPRARYLYESFGFTTTSTNMAMPLD